jgi:hypothetical protein
MGFSNHISLCLLLGLMTFLINSQILFGALNCNSVSVEPALIDSTEPLLDAASTLPDLCRVINPVAQVRVETASDQPRRCWTLTSHELTTVCCLSPKRSILVEATSLIFWLMGTSLTCMSHD